MSGLNYGYGYRLNAKEISDKDEGVHFFESSKKWVVRIGVRGQIRSVAQYISKKEAEDHYDFLKRRIQKELERNKAPEPLIIEKGFVFYVGKLKNHVVNIVKDGEDEVIVWKSWSKKENSWIYEAINKKDFSLRFITKKGI